MIQPERPDYQKRQFVLHLVNTIANVAALISLSVSLVVFFNWQMQRNSIPSDRPPVVNPEK